MPALNLETYTFNISSFSEHPEKIGASWRSDNPVALKNLSLIQLKHWGFDHKINQGEIVVHEKVAQEVAEIFGKLFDNHYPIEKMILIDHYNADDEASCSDNNTSAFCSRAITGNSGNWSLHSLGLAIDINPKYNPYQKADLVVPENGKPYLDRDHPHFAVINTEDLCLKVFRDYGWQWGGDWIETRGYVDYQHFYKEVDVVEKGV